jgi:hypothetical protein
MLKRLLLSLLLIGTILNATAPTKATVARLYLATFDRAPDAKGLEYWLNESGLTLEQIAQSFFDQIETKDKYPDELDFESFIQSVYQNLFRRGVDSDGFEYWLKGLESGGIDKNIFILAVINGALGDDSKILANKLTVALAFVDANKDDIIEAYEIMLPITADTSTVNPTLCKHTLVGCYVAPKPKEETTEEDSTKEETATEEDSSTSGGSTSNGANPPPPPPPASNTKPVANAGADKIDVARTVPEAISGLDSSDADNDTLTYLWSVTSSPDGSNPTIASPTSADTTFTADKEGVYTLSLVVNDGTDDSTADIITITVTPSSTIKKTGQTNVVIENDDGTYQAGVAHDYIATTVGDDKIVLDNITHLVWQDSSLQSDKSWVEADSYCTNLNFAGDSNNWRLPTVKELVYIINSSTTTNPAGFTDTTTGDFWSSTPYAVRAGRAWSVNFGDSSMGDTTDVAKLYVRCVLGGV